MDVFNLFFVTVIADQLLYCLISASLTLPAWVLGFAEDFQKLFVGEEEKPGEIEPLLLQVLVEASLDELQELSWLPEPLQNLVHVQHRQDPSVEADTLHDVLPSLVYRVESEKHRHTKMHTTKSLNYLSIWIFKAKVNLSKG